MTQPEERSDNVWFGPSAPGAMARHTLNADELGEKGQSRFQEICADAKLVCNKSYRDRTGWDFIVEFPFSDTEGQRSLDSRDAPPSSLVQVKTLLAHNNSFKMRLSAAERLAKEIKPAFIYVFKVDGSEFIDAFLIHLIDEPLAKILMSLRKEYAAGNASVITKKSITFSVPRYGKRFEPTGDALRDAIADACGPNLHEYATRKKNQRESLGFEKFPFKGTIRIRPENLDDISDISLGLKDASVVEFQSFQTRFGITLPLHSLSSNNLVFRISPSPVDHCTVTVRSDRSSEPYVFRGDLFIPVIPVPEDKIKWLLKSQIFSLEISQESFSITPAEDIESQRQRPSIWADYWKGLLVFTKNGVIIEVSSDTGRVYFSLNIGDQIFTFDHKICTFWIDLCEQVLFIFRMAGVAADAELSLREIGENSTEILRASCVLRGEGAEISFTGRRTNYVDDIVPLRALFVHYFSFGDIMLAYSAVIDLVPEILDDRILWKSIRIEPGTIRSLRKGQYTDFVEARKVEVSVDKLLVKREPEGRS